MMKKLLFWFLALAGLGGFLLCGVMTVSAVGALEWGRVVLYGFGALLSLELLVFSAFQVKK